MSPLIFIIIRTYYSMVQRNDKQIHSVIGIQSELHEAGENKGHVESPAGLGIGGL